MQGKGRIEGEEPGTLRTLATSSETADKYKHLVDEKGEWVVRDDVSFYWSRGLPGAGADPELDVKGGLTVGYGGKENHIGPELQFGHAVGDESGHILPAIQRACVRDCRFRLASRVE